MSTRQAKFLTGFQKKGNKKGTGKRSTMINEEVPPKAVYLFTRRENKNKKGTGDQ